MTTSNQRTEKRVRAFGLAALSLAVLVVLDLSACRPSEDTGAGSQVARPSGAEPEEESAAAENAAGKVRGVPPSRLSGTVEGTVRFVGERLPGPTIVPVGGDAQFCGHEYSKEDWVIDPVSRGIRHALVHLSGQGLIDWPSRPGHLLLDNKNCRFDPHAAVLTVGSTIEVKNSDKILHTAHGYFAATFNVALPGGGANQKRQLSRPGIVQIRCDRHGWMNAFVRVDRHPFHAVTDAAGRFKIEGVPPGTYTLEVWHERSGSKTQEIAVKEKQVTRVELTFVE